MTRPIVILRPEPGASLSASRAADMGLENVHAVPLFKVRPADWTPPEPDRFDAILMTSANAARHGGEGLAALRDLPVHAVGESTAAAARAAGMMVGEVGEGGVDDLLAILPSDARLLHLSGRHRRMPEDATQTIVPVTVYTSVAREEPKGFSAVEGAIACIHSPRAGRRFATLVDERGYERAAIAVVAISEEAASDVGEGWASVEIANDPTDRSLLRAVRRLVQDPR
ncbi:uroporphyrinogen-III synthase [Sphingomicrobium sp. XHP0235]|uniref:uroporphyrinogen-III synthase n=1 Tax=Sphingomicrobium aquimarinum TaxID=3133971 RepID=UPI0031FF3670